MRNSYQLDTSLAKQVGASGRITTSGKYVGRFTRAEAVTSKQSTEGVEFTFETDDGQTADFLTCWTHNADGKELYGLKVLNAILTCMRLRGVNAKPGKVADRNGGQRDATVFPELMSRPIGLLLQKEEYEKRDGSVGFKFNIAAPFEAASGLMAAEILGNVKEATQLDRMLAGLRDKPMASRPAQSEYASSGHPSVSGGSNAAFDDQDIPFNSYAPRRASYVV